MEETLTDANDSPTNVVASAIAALNAGDLEGYFERHTPDTALYAAGRASVQDALQYREQLSTFCALHPDLQVKPTRFISEGATVVMESTLLLDGDASDEPHPEVIVFDIDGGRIAETTVYSRTSIADRAMSGRA
jgi:hypothetical protein